MSKLNNIKYSVIGFILGSLTIGAIGSFAIGEEINQFIATKVSYPILINDKVLESDTMNINNKTYIPIRDFAIGLGANVNWIDGKVIISSNVVGDETKKEINIENINQSVVNTPVPTPFSTLTPTIRITPTINTTLKSNIMNYSVVQDRSPKLDGYIPVVSISQNYHTKNYTNSSSLNDNSEYCYTLDYDNKNPQDVKFYFVKGYSPSGKKEILFEISKNKIQISHGTTFINSEYFNNELLPIIQKDSNLN